MEEPESNYEKFTVYVALPSLQELVARSLARSILFHFLTYTTRKFGIADTYAEVSRFYARKHIACLEIPASIKAMIDQGLKEACAELLEFLIHFYGNSFSGNLKHHLVTRFNLEMCVWHQNGEIDYEKTALSMLSGAGFGELQKFAVMCSYCLEEQITNFNLESLPENLLPEMNSDQNLLMRYWICRLKNELNEIPLDDFGSIDALMAFNSDNWHMKAFKYFWNRLSQDDQISVAMQLFSKPSWVLVTRDGYGELFSMLSGDQQMRIFLDTPQSVVKNLMPSCDSNFPQFFSRVWENCKDLMTAENFAFLAIEIFAMAQCDEEGMQMLIGLWQTAPDAVLEFAQSALQEEIVYDLYPQANSPNDDLVEFHETGYCVSFFQFLRVYLSKETDYFKKTLMLKNDVFGVACNVGFLRQIIDLCLPNADDRVEFKTFVASSFNLQRCCYTMMKLCDFENLRLKLVYFFPDVGSRLEFQKKIIAWFITREFHYHNFDLSKWNQLDIFVRETYHGEDAAVLLNVMKHLCYKLFVDCTFYPSYNFAQFDRLKIIVQSVFVGEELAEFKKAFLYRIIRFEFHYPYTLTNCWDIFQEAIFSKVVPWCLNNNTEDIGQFKKENFTVEDFFFAILLRFGKFIHSSVYDRMKLDHRVFSRLDECLKWYLQDDEQIRKCKLEKLNSADFLMLFKPLLKRKAGGVNCKSCLVVALQWFFDGDEAAIFEFISEKSEP